MDITINHKKHHLKTKKLYIRNYKNRLFKITIFNYEILIYLTKRHTLSDIFLSLMKPIIINGDKWFYKVIEKEIQDEILIYMVYNTHFYKHPKKMVKKYLFFGKEIEVENIIPDFSLNINIEDSKYNKEDIEKHIGIKMNIDKIKLVKIKTF